MTIDAEIAALPKMPADDDEAWHAVYAVGAGARLALLRRVLQEMVDNCPCFDGVYDGDPCANCADARKVLEACR